MSKIAKVPLVPPSVNSQRKIPEHYIKSSFEHVIQQ